MSDKSVVHTLVLTFVYLHKSEPGAVQLNNTRRLLRMGGGGGPSLAGSARQGW
jgi:hypothetical protein